MEIKADKWVWGQELIIWGYEPSHAYTFKILEPKKGRAGCLSLQFHHKKSESWLVLRGIAWGLFVVGDNVCTRVMRAGDVQNITPPMIHRLMAVTDDVRVAEPSTPDAHAADKSAPKDVIRLHCVLGRPCESGKTESEKAIIAQCIKVTEDAIKAIEAGKIPEEINRKLLDDAGASKLP